MNTCPICGTEYEREGYCKVLSCAIRLVQFDPQEIDQIRGKFATQAAEIARLTAAERLLRAVAANLEIADKSGENWLRVFVAVETAAEIVAFCTPQPQAAQEPETPVLSRYAADIAALAAGEITESEFFERQGRRPI